MPPLKYLAYAVPAALLLASHGALADEALDMNFAGALEFTDEGTLFVGDNYNGAIYAFEMPGAAAETAVEPRSIGDIDVRIADLLGVGPSAIEINDMAVHPVSKEVYISLSRIGNFASRPAIVKVALNGDITLVDLAETPFQKQELTAFPSGNVTFRPRGLGDMPPLPRDIAKGDIALNSLAIMDMEYYDGELFVAGVAHDNFLSSLRRMSYPFDGTQDLASVEMYHIAHDTYETRAPIRAMSIQEVDGEPQLIAAYTCSPIVLVPLSDIEDGAKIAANTIIDMGNGQPLDMIPYQMGDQTMLFVTNNSRSPQVIPVSGLNDAQVVTHVDFERGPKLDLHPQLPFGPTGEMVMFEGVPLHMALADDGYFVSLTRDAYTGSLNLDTNPTWFPNRIHNLVAEFDFPQFDPAVSAERMK